MHYIITIRRNIIITRVLITVQLIDNSSLRRPATSRRAAQPASRAGPPWSPMGPAFIIMLIIMISSSSVTTTTTNNNDNNNNTNNENNNNNNIIIIMHYHYHC